MPSKNTGPSALALRVLELLRARGQLTARQTGDLLPPSVSECSVGRALKELVAATLARRAGETKGAGSRRAFLFEALPAAPSAPPSVGGHGSTASPIPDPSTLDPPADPTPQAA